MSELNEQSVKDAPAGYTSLGVLEDDWFIFM